MNVVLRVNQEGTQMETVHAVYEGKTFRLKHSLDLKPGKVCFVDSVCWIGLLNKNELIHQQVDTV